MEKQAVVSQPQQLRQRTKEFCASNRDALSSTPQVGCCEDAGQAVLEVRDVSCGELPACLQGAFEG